jgi:serine/threonine protein kinase
MRAPYDMPISRNLLQGVLDNGEHVAVKKLIYQPGLGDDQFKNELVNLIGVQHQNIVQLIGYCYETRKKLFPYNGNFVFAECVERALCLEYLQGGSLDDHLSGMVTLNLNYFYMLRETDAKVCGC